jgi:hypothetical protein
VLAAARSLPPWRRASFMATIADCLETVHTPGDLAVNRAIEVALSRFAGNGGNDPMAA